jgi:hypothetical protein
MAQMFGRNTQSIPATLPIPEMVARLNALQPAILNGYPSIVFALTSEASVGRLNIHPRLVMCGSEPFLPEMRHRIGDVWSVRVINTYFTSEGASVSDCGAGRHALDWEIKVALRRPGGMSASAASIQSREAARSRSMRRPPQSLILALTVPTILTAVSLSQFGRDIGTRSRSRKPRA